MASYMRGHTSGRLGRIVAGALVALVAGCGAAHKPPPPRPAPTPTPAPKLGDFFGVYSDDVFFGSESYRRRTLAEQRAAGIGLVRTPFSWSDYAKSPARYDSLVRDVAQRGMQLLPIVLGPQPGAAPAGQGAMQPPRDPAAYARFAAGLVRRFPKIHGWQIWNEPNIPAFWGGHPDPVAYARLLRTASAAVRKANPSAEVVTAGLPTSHLGMPAAAFLEAMYGAGAKGSFDTVAVHAYAPTPAGVVQRVKEIHDVIARNGDNARIWITEVGWGTAGQPGPFTVSAAQQARYVSQTLRLLEAKRDALDLRGIILFQWRDPKPFPGRRPIWPYYAGLLTDKGHPKPSLGALERAANGA